MAEDAPAIPTAARHHRRISAFRNWRRGRPFWGGLLMMLAGVEIFLSSNEDLGSLHVQIGVTGFLSYIVPLFVILCGALVWATPSQRILYGILANAAAIYSIVSVNLGGFLLGMLLGIVGGSLAAAWVPDKFGTAEIPAQRVGEPDDQGTSYGSEATTDDFFNRTSDEESDVKESEVAAFEVEASEVAAFEVSEDKGVAGDTVDADEPTISGTEGKQGARFPGPRHSVTGARPDEVTRSVIPTALPRRSPRAVAIALVVTSVGAIGFLIVHTAGPAAAAACVPPTLTQIVNEAKDHPAGSKGKSSLGKKSPVAGQSGAQSAGEAPVVPRPQPIASVLSGLGGLLGLAPSDSPSALPSDSPSDSPPATPSNSPTASPSPSPSHAPVPDASPSTSPAVSPSDATTAAPTASASCAVIPKTLPPEPGLPLAAATVSTQKASKLTMSGLSYDGNYALPTKLGPIEVMQFSMDSSTSTPFELDVVGGGKTVAIKSPELTVSGHVKFYATEIKGNVLGGLPADYTPDNPPPLVPSLVTPALFFTDVTIGLAYVTCDTLTASGLTITSPA